METANLPEKTETIRVCVDLAYGDTDFHGWAAQPELRTVQGEIETVPTLVVRMPPMLIVMGRTDTGIYTRRQAMHVNISLDVWQAFAPRGADREDDVVIGITLARRFNALIAQAHGEQGRRHGLLTPRGSLDIVISRISRVSADFDVRFSALGQSYCYRTCEDISDPLRGRDVLSVLGPLNLETMNRGVAALLGEYDFLSYRRLREEVTTIRALRCLELTRLRGTVECRVEADAFCHSMTRSLVGARLLIGQGRRPESWFAQSLEECSCEGMTPIAPVHDLILEDVHYPEEERWASRVKAAR